MAWSVIQSAKGVNFGSTVAATFSTANLSSGTKIIAVVASNFSNAPTSVQDGASNALTQLAAKATSTGSVWLYAMDTPAGDVGTKPTITATLSGSNGQSIVIQEVSGLLAGNTSAMIDGTPGVLSGSTQNPGSPTYSSTAANEYLVCIYGNGNVATTVTAVDGTWTLDANSNTSQSHASIEYKNSTNGAETGGFNTTSTGGWSDAMVAFKLPGGTSHTATAALTVTPVLAATRVHAAVRTAALTVTPVLAATRLRSVTRTAALTVTPVLAATRVHAAVRTAALTVTPVLHATAAGGRAPAVAGNQRAAGRTPVKKWMMYSDL